MTTHNRNISASIDPVKLDRLAEIAVKVGLQLQGGAGLVADRAGRRAAAGAADRRTCLSRPAPASSRRILSDEEVTLARYRFAQEAEFRPRGRLAL